MCPTCQQGECFFREIQRPFRWVSAVRSSQKKGKKIKDLGRRIEQASVSVKRRCRVLEKTKTCSCSWFESKPYMVLCYSASNETDISNVRFSSSLLTLPSIRSSSLSNFVCWLLVHLLFSRQQPDMRKSQPVPLPVGLITPSPARAL